MKVNPLNREMMEPKDSVANVDEPSLKNGSCNDSGIKTVGKSDCTSSMNGSDISGEGNGSADKVIAQLKDDVKNAEGNDLTRSKESAQQLIDMEGNIKKINSSSDDKELEQLKKSGEVLLHTDDGETITIELNCEEGDSEIAGDTNDDAVTIIAEKAPTKFVVPLRTPIPKHVNKMKKVVTSTQKNFAIPVQYGVGQLVISTKLPHLQKIPFSSWPSSARLVPHKTGIVAMSKPNVKPSNLVRHGTVVHKPQAPRLPPKPKGPTEDDILIAYLKKMRVPLNMSSLSCAIINYMKEHEVVIDPLTVDFDELYQQQLDDKKKGKFSIPTIKKQEKCSVDETSVTEKEQLNMKANKSENSGEDVNITVVTSLTDKNTNSISLNGKIKGKEADSPDKDAENVKNSNDGPVDSKTNNPQHENMPSVNEQSESVVTKKSVDKETGEHINGGHVKTSRTQSDNQDCIKNSEVSSTKETVVTLEGEAVNNVKDPKIGNDQPTTSKVTDVEKADDKNIISGQIVNDVKVNNDESVNAENNEKYDSKNVVKEATEGKSGGDKDSNSSIDVKEKKLEDDSCAKKVDLTTNEAVSEGSVKKAEGVCEADPDKTTDIKSSKKDITDTESSGKEVNKAGSVEVEAIEKGDAKVSETKTDKKKSQTLNNKTVDDDDDVKVIKDDAPPGKEQLPKIECFTDDVDPDHENVARKLRPVARFLYFSGLDFAKDRIYKDVIRSKTNASRKRKLSDDEDKHLRTVKYCSGKLSKKCDPFRLKLSKCFSCAFSTESSNVLYFHRQKGHLDKSGKYSCAVCDFETRLSSAFYFHMEAEHSMKGILQMPLAFWECSSCSFENNSKSKVTRHKPKCEEKFDIKKHLFPVYDDINFLFRSLPGELIRKDLPKQVPAPQISKYDSKVKQMPVLSRAPAMKTVSKPVGVTNQGQVVVLAGKSSGQVSGQVYYYMTPNGPVPITIQSGNTGYVRATPAVVNSMSSTVVATTSTNVISSTTINAKYPVPVKRVAVGNSNAIVQQFAKKRPAMNNIQNTLDGSASKSPRYSYEVCEICNGFIKDKESLRIHFMMAHKIEISKEMFMKRNIPPLSCEMCSERFWTYQGLTHHRIVKKHLVGPGGSCMVCNKQFVSLNQHFNDFHKFDAVNIKNVVICPVCNVSNVDNMNLHMQTNHGITFPEPRTLIMCHTCDIGFPNLSAHDAHMMKKHGLRCPRCTYICKTPKELQTHIQQTHGTGLQQCTICNKMILRGRPFINHVTQMHIRKCLVKVHRCNVEKLKNKLRKRKPVESSKVIAYVQPVLVVDDDDVQVID